MIKPKSFVPILVLKSPHPRMLKIFDPSRRNCTYFLPLSVNGKAFISDMSYCVRLGWRTFEKMGGKVP